MKSKKEMWTAEWMSEVDGELSFGNISSRIYPTPEMAWNACKRDFKKTQKEHTECNQSFVNDDNCYAELWSDGCGHTRFAWSIQKMNEYNRKKTSKK